MRSVSDISNSIKAINQTSQITKAMKLIATSKMQKAISRYDANLIYFNGVRATIKDIMMHSRNLNHTFFERHEEGIPAYIVIAADKGLAGGYNHNILTYAMDFMTKGEKFIITIGQEARAFFERRHIPIDVEYLHIAQNPTLYEARKLVDDFAGMYREGIMSEVYLIYTRYYSNIKQKPVALQLLPVEMHAFDDVDIALEYQGELYYHPSRHRVFDVLIPQYIIGLVYGSLIQAFASENSARMMAMDSASRSADELMAKLNIEMNHARQQAVTREITEIVSAMDAMTEEE